MSIHLCSSMLTLEDRSLHAPRPASRKRLPRRAPLAARPHKRL